jgi:succinate-semialdehyde dehydrogenase / glutarate-semialdehyde dehydrogenase
MNKNLAMHKITNQSIIKNCSFINGEWLGSSSFFDVINPADISVVAEVNEVQAQQVVQAINAAHAAQTDWKRVPVKERAILLNSWQRLIRKNVKDLSRLLTLEQGKPITESEVEILHGADYTQLYSELAEGLLVKQEIDAPEGQTATVIRRPVGVVSAITPWNFPCSMVMRKAAAAIAAGCSVVLKPSELTPLTSLALAALSQQAGLPNGVFNVVVGSNAQAIGELMSQNSNIAKLSFTGSTQVGKKLLAQCAFGVTRASMELGGNAPFIVFEDADLDSAVEGAMASKFRNAGQTCVSANRFIIHKSILQEFQKRLISQVEQLVVGNGSESASNIGPLINQSAIDKIDHLISASNNLGARATYRASLGQFAGYFYPPTVLENVMEDMPIFHNEIFGPVVAITSFDSEAQAIQLANQTNMRLCGYFYSEDIERQKRLTEQLEFGMLGVNQARLSNPAAPFGGFRQSGIGREGGRFGIDEYLDFQYISRPYSQ